MVLGPRDGEAGVGDQENGAAVAGGAPEGAAGA